MADIKIVNPQNEPLVKHFIAISDLYLRLNEKRKFSTFRKVATILGQVEDVITKETDITEHSGIGDSSWQVQQQFFDTGTSERFVELNEQLVTHQEELDNRTLEEKVASKIASTSQLGEAQIVATLIMWSAGEGLFDAQSMIDNIQSAPPFLRDAGLLEALNELK